MQIVQFMREGRRWVGVLEKGAVSCVNGATSVLELSRDAIAHGRDLAAEVRDRGAVGAVLGIDELLAAGSLLPPLDHPDNAHFLVSGTGLTHLGSASTRDQMHRRKLADAPVTDTQAMFELGVRGGRPKLGEAGVQPEWFYKGDGTVVVSPGAGFPWPSYGEDLGEEPEVVGLYVIDDHGAPWRVGYALGNEVSDHVMEKRNYLYLAHSKLRFCSFGPALVTGELPRAITGVSRIWRDGKVMWHKTFDSGEDNMCHSIQNLEYHHFKYPQFRRPGDVHAHFFGTATLSFADDVRPQAGDMFEIECAYFGVALKNTIVHEMNKPFPPGCVMAL